MERGPDSATSAGGIDCYVSGTASDVYMTMWNRLPVGTLRTEGDAGVLDWLLREAPHQVVLTLLQ